MNHYIFTHYFFYVRSLNHSRWIYLYASSKLAYLLISFWYYQLVLSTRKKKLDRNGNGISRSLGAIEGCQRCKNTWMEPRAEPVLRDAVSRAVVQNPAEGAAVSRKRSSIGNRTCCPLNGLYLFPSCTVNACFAVLSLSYPSRSSSSGQTRASVS